MVGHENRIDRSFKRTNKLCYKISDNIDNFLGGLTTNNLDAEKNAFLDRFGRLIVLFDQKKDDDSIFIVFEKDYEDRFLDHVSKYARLTGSKIEKIEKEVYHIIGKAPEGLCFPQNIGHLYVSDKKPDLPEIGDKGYDPLRLEHNIPLQGIDFHDEMFLNIGIDAIDYEKGCYLGQEVVARVHNLGRPPKKLVRLSYETLPDSVTADGREIARITTSAYSPKHKKYLAFAMIPRDKKPDSSVVLPKQGKDSDYEKDA